MLSPRRDSERTRLINMAWRIVCGGTRSGIVQIAFALMSRPRRP